MSGPWSSEQREWLQALGFDVLTLAGTPSAGDARPATPPADDERLRDAPALVAALCRAAGGVEPHAVIGLVTNIDALRISPTAKRALWPRLRAMRKARRA